MHGLFLYRSTLIWSRGWRHWKCTSARRTANIPRCLGAVAACRTKWSVIQTLAVRVVATRTKRKCHRGIQPVSFRIGSLFHGRCAVLDFGVGTFEAFSDFLQSDYIYANQNLPASVHAETSCRRWRHTLLLNVVMCSINIGHIIAWYYTSQLVLWHHNHLIVPFRIIAPNALPGSVVVYCEASATSCVHIQQIWSLSLVTVCVCTAEQWESDQWLERRKNRRPLISIQNILQWSNKCFNFYLQNFKWTNIL